MDVESVAGPSLRAMKDISGSVANLRRIVIVDQDRKKAAVLYEAMKQEMGRQEIQFSNLCLEIIQRQLIRFDLHPLIGQL
jgi:hypothetical protein